MPCLRTERKIILFICYFITRLNKPDKVILEKIQLMNNMLNYTFKGLKIQKKNIIIDVEFRTVNCFKSIHIIIQNFKLYIRM